MLGYRSIVSDPGTKCMVYEQSASCKGYFTSSPTLCIGSCLDPRITNPPKPTHHSQSLYRLSYPDTPITRLIQN